MKILFTGASSFSGMWFVKELLHAGHEVTATFKRPFHDYTGIRRQRVDLILSDVEGHFDISFGDEKFLHLIERHSFDLFCHHAADVTDYRSPNFEVGKAVASNTRHIKSVFEGLMAKGCSTVLLTGSVFEPNEGVSDDGILPALSPYGLSKGLTSEIFTYYAQMLKLTLGKFVIPNPFGPYEEGRFTNYLAQNWLDNKIPTVNTPLYIRDNIPVTLLAKAYAAFAQRLFDDKFSQKSLPSYFNESQGDFTARFAAAMHPRLHLPCAFELKLQTEFPEPLKRVNTTPLAAPSLNWQEDLFWDQAAEYYQMLHHSRNAYASK